MSAERADQASASTSGSLRRGSALRQANPYNFAGS
jgi:hypothetical protein